MSDDEARSLGFRDEYDMTAAIAAVDFSQPLAVEKFGDWKANDGTATGLVRRFPYLDLGVQTHSE